jgi:hypothetical protein
VKVRGATTRAHRGREQRRRMCRPLRALAVSALIVGGCGGRKRSRLPMTHQYVVPMRTPYSCKALLSRASALPSAAVHTAPTSLIMMRRWPAGRRGYRYPSTEREV